MTVPIIVLAGLIAYLLFSVMMGRIMSLNDRKAEIWMPPSTSINQGKGSAKIIPFERGNRDKRIAQGNAIGGQQVGGGLSSPEAS